MMRNIVTKLRGVIRDLMHYIRRGEFIAAVRWVFDTLRILLCHRIEYIVFTRSLEEPLPSYEARLPIAYYRMAEPDDLSHLRNAVLPSEFKYMRKRLAYGRICTLALHEGNLAAQIWASDELSFEVDNLELRLRPGDVYLDDAYTLPAYRHQGVYSALDVQQLRYLQEGGYKRAVAIVAADNIPPLKVLPKLGYQEADRLSFQRILFRRDYRYHNSEF